MKNIQENLKTKKNFKNIQHFILTHLVIKKFLIKNIKLPKLHIVPRKFRLTIDTKKDYIFFEKLFKCINKKHKEITPKDINKALKENPNLSKINNKVHQYVPRIT